MRIFDCDINDCDEIFFKKYKNIFNGKRYSIQAIASEDLGFYI